jgi:hypothetical protein
VKKRGVADACCVAPDAVPAFAVVVVVVVVVVESNHAWQVALAVQQFALKALPTVAPYLAGSLKCVLGQAVDTPRHFKLSLSQHSELLHTAPAHLIVALLALSFVPALHAPEHVTFVVQQFALKSLPTAAPYLAGSLKCVLGQAVDTP